MSSLTADHTDLDDAVGIDHTDHLSDLSNSLPDNATQMVKHGTELYICVH